MANSENTLSPSVKADYKPIPIGTENKPWPTTLRGQDVGGVPTFGMGVIQSNSAPLWLDSARPYSEVMPELYRDMHVPGMSEAFESILKNPLVYLESSPGYGKTFLAKYVCNAMHPKGGIIADAGGKNLESLLYETVFDSNASSDLVDRINTALAEGTLTEPALNALRELKTKQGTEGERSLLSEENGKKIFDWKGLQGAGIQRAEIDSVLTSVQKYQEWNGGLRIGFKDVPGKLIRAAMENRPLVIDEFARRKPGTEAALQQVWQVISGEIPEMTIPLGNLGEFTLRYKDIPKVIITSNSVSDGPDVHAISDSLSSRFVFVKIPSFTLEDWAHRISQKLTGLPVTTLARLEKGKMSTGATAEDAQWQVNNSQQFTKNLHAIHRANRTAVPALQTTLIDNWPALTTASHALAQAFHQSAELLDPESPTLQQPSMAEIRYEIDKPGDKVKKLTPRETLRILENAIHHMAESVPAEKTKGADFSDWSMPNIVPSTEAIEANLGNRMKALIEKWIDTTAEVTVDGAGRPKLYERLKDVWKNAGVIGPQSVLNGLNIKSRDTAIASDEAKKAQAAINALLQHKYPDAEGITPQQAEMFLQNLNMQSPPHIGDETVLTHVLSTNPDNISNGIYNEEASVATHPHSMEENSFSNFLKRHPAEKLVSQEQLITTLALPHNTEFLEAISKRADAAEKVDAAQYDTQSQHMITSTLAQAADGSYAKLHVLHDRTSDKTLIISMKPTSVKLPADSNVTLVQAADEDAKDTVEKWIKNYTAGAESTLKKAFEVRNALQDKHKNLSLAEMLTSTDIKAFSPTIVDSRIEVQQDGPSTVVHLGTLIPKTTIQASR